MIDGKVKFQEDVYQQYRSLTLQEQAKKNGKKDINSNHETCVWKNTDAGLFAERKRNVKYGKQCRKGREFAR